MSRAQEFVEQHNREHRIETAQAGSTEEQLARHENWALKRAKKIEAKRNELKNQGDLSEQGIQKEIDADIAAFEKEAQKRIDEQVKPTLEGQRPEHALPEQSDRVTAMLVNKYVGLPESERRDWFRDARTGNDKDLALALVRAPQRVTGISDDAREAMRQMFMSEADQTSARRYTDLQSRATAVVDTFESVRRRLRK